MKIKLIMSVVKLAEFRYWFWIKCNNLSEYINRAAVNSRKRLNDTKEWAAVKVCERRMGPLPSFPEQEDFIVRFDDPYISLKK